MAHHLIGQIKISSDMRSTIQFNFTLDDRRPEVLLEADIELESPGIYIVSNFRMPGHKQTAILPDIRIKKHEGHWVHCDSEWQTALSLAVGKAITTIHSFAGNGETRGTPQTPLYPHPPSCP